MQAARAGMAAHGTLARTGRLDGVLADRQLITPALDSSSERFVASPRHLELLGSEATEAAEHLDEHRPGEPCVLLARQFAQPFKTEPIDQSGDIDEVTCLGRSNSARSLSAPSSSTDSIGPRGRCRLGEDVTDHPDLRGLRLAAHRLPTWSPSLVTIVRSVVNSGARTRRWS
jgi:hypothetical protein